MHQWNPPPLNGRALSTHALGDGILTPSKHWIYANGQKSGPVRFNIHEIRQWQAGNTIERFNSRPEAYQESN